MVADPTDEALRLRAVLQMTAVGQALLAGQEPVMADFFFDVARGEIPGMRAVNKFGRSTNVDNGIATDIWDGANATLDQDIWIPPTQARVHAIVSSSASDDGDPGGVGARTIRVYGLTSWSTKEVTEDITLNGTGSVNTTNSYVIIHRLRVLTKGATSSNVGIIKATAASDGTITAQINAGEGQTQMAIYGIPSTQKAYMTNFYATLNRATPAAALANMTLLFNPEPDSEELTYVTRNTHGLEATGSSHFDHFFGVPVEFPGPGIIKLQASASADNADVSGGFDLVLVNN